jgi:hypothetical protein
MILQEWWIEDRNTVTHADGDSGDQNHEGVVVERSIGLLLDELQQSSSEGIQKLSASLTAEYQDDMVYFIADVLDVSDALYKSGDLTQDAYDDPWRFMQEEGIDTDLIKAASNRDMDHRLFGMQKWGWSAVRQDRIDTFGLTSRKMKDIGFGILEIAEEEGIRCTDDEWVLQDFKTMRVYTVDTHFLISGDVQGLFGKSKGELIV